MSALVQDLITSAMTLIGVLADGELPTSSETNTALFAFQSMVDSWNAESLMIFTTQRLLFPLIPTKQTYSYGIGGDFNAPRPASIERMGIIWLGNPAQPLELPMQYLTTAQWAALPVKNIQSTLPQYCWDDGAFPMRNLNFWPIPSAADQVAIYPWQALTAPATLTTVIAMPPGYQQALRFNLASMLAAEFPPVAPQVLQLVTSIALSSKATVKAMNTEMIDLRCDPAITPVGRDGLYNWISDQPVGGRG